MKITIGISTYNRADLLDKTLESLRSLRSLSAPHDHEIIIVENNCNDHTLAVLEKHKDFFQNRLRIFHESRQGVSWGRNLIIREAIGEIIAYTDDDALVDSSWLLNIMQAYERWPDAWGIGGKTYLILEGQPPSWLGKQERTYLAELNLGDTALLISKDQVMFSLNLTLKKNIFDKIGLFRTDLGPAGRMPIGAEETELLRRIHGVNGKLYYDPSMIVGHRISGDRLKKKWFFWRLYWHGCSLVRRNPGSSFLKEFSGAAKNLGRVFYCGFFNGFHSDPVYSAGKSLAVQTGKMAQLLADFTSFYKRDK